MEQLIRQFMDWYWSREEIAYRMTYFMDYYSATLFTDSESTLMKRHGPTSDSTKVGPCFDSCNWLLRMYA